jgi:hypothetical protein
MVGRRVAFVPAGGSAGAFDPDTAVTNSQGQATTSWVLGTTPGNYSGEARIVVPPDSAAPVTTLQASAVAGQPDTLRAVGSTSQPGRRNQPLAQPLTVMAVDRFGNPVENAEVDWSVDQGDGELSADTSRTAADGSASVTWTLGDRIGIQKASASVQGANGSPLTFTAVVLF